MNVGLLKLEEFRYKVVINDLTPWCIPGMVSLNALEMGYLVDTSQVILTNLGERV